MPPRKTQGTKANSKKAAARPERAQTEKARAEPDPSSKPEDAVRAREELNGEDAPKPKVNSNAQSNTSKKRKSASGAPESPGKPAKAPRQGSRTSFRITKQSTSAAPSVGQILNFLLSPAALPYCHPDDDLTAPEKRKYSTTSPAAFTAFEHLLTASLLSKSLSHRLGMRSMSTFLNLSFDFNSPGKLTKAGEKRGWEALEAARTQHR